jgi:uncharacterized protein
MSEARAKPLRPTLDDVLRTLRTQLPELREQYGVRTLGVFGSYVRGEQKPRSDLDLLVEFDARPLTLIQVIALEQHLSDLLGVKVDLVEMKALKPAIGRQILREIVPV